VYRANPRPALGQPPRATAAHSSSISLASTLRIGGSQTTQKTERFRLAGVILHTDHLHSRTCEESFRDERGVQEE